MEYGCELPDQSAGGLMPDCDRVSRDLYLARNLLGEFRVICVALYRTLFPYVSECKKDCADGSHLSHQRLFINTDIEIPHVLSEHPSFQVISSILQRRPRLFKIEIADESAVITFHLTDPTGLFPVITLRVDNEKCDYTLTMFGGVHTADYIKFMVCEDTMYIKAMGNATVSSKIDATRRFTFIEVRYEDIMTQFLVENYVAEINSTGYYQMPVDPGRVWVSVWRPTMPHSFFRSNFEKFTHKLKCVSFRDFRRIMVRDMKRAEENRPHFT